MCRWYWESNVNTVFSGDEKILKLHHDNNMLSVFLTNISCNVVAGQVIMSWKLSIGMPLILKKFVRPRRLRSILKNFPCDFRVAFVLQKHLSCVFFRHFQVMFQTYKKALKPTYLKEKRAISRLFGKWSWRDLNPCPKTNSLFFYYHSLSFNSPSTARGQTPLRLQ